MNNLEGYTALVTGASGAIGSEIALTLARQKIRVMLHYRSGEAEAQALARRIREEDGIAETYGADITSEEEVQMLMNRCVERFKGIDILVLCAGVTADSLLVQMPLERWNMVMSANVTGAFLCCKYALRVMLRAKYGRIIGISSLIAKMGNAGQANYAASKAALTGLILSVAQEYSPRGIRANVVAPGLIESQMVERMTPAARAAKLDRIMLNRMGTPAEVAAVTAFLASPEADYINGSVIQVDGGVRL